MEILVEVYSGMTQSETTRRIIDTHRHIFVRNCVRPAENIGFDDQNAAAGQCWRNVFLSRVD